MSIAAEFRGSIATSIPHIINLLNNRDSNVRRAGAEALSKLSEQGM
jgi:HEAT repeat protein